MRISFVIPALNEEHFIGPCLVSVQREIRRFCLDAEIIVVDNGSTDATAKIAASFPRVKVVCEPKRGLSAARHRGYLSSSGELIANLDADTHVPPGWAPKVLKWFQREKRLACLSGPYIYYDMSYPSRILSIVYYCFVALYHLLSQYVFRNGAVAQGGNFIVRRDMLDRIGGYNTDIVFYGEDTDIASRLATVGKVRFRLGLIMFSSARRLLKEGVWRSGYTYAMNNIFRMFYGRPITMTHTDVRTD